MRSLARLVLIASAFAAAPAQAQQVVTVVDEWVVDDGASRFVSESVAQADEHAVAAYGPFRVLDGAHAALVDVTDRASPGEFAAMLHDFPSLRTLELLDCPGTIEDAANLRLGRMIRAAGLATRVPNGGSVRSGGVELFLAGRTREIADGAEFAVHAWEDQDGQQAGDYPATAPENAKYIAYYREMGMNAATAKAFYAMTNSAPFEHPLWLTGADIRPWSDAERDDGAPHLAYLDLAGSLN